MNVRLKSDLFDYRQNVVFSHQQQLVVAEFDFIGTVTGEQHFVTRLQLKFTS